MQPSQIRTSRKSQSGRTKQDDRKLSVAGWVMAAFLLLVFLTGGGSRSDISSLPLLRGSSVIFACWAMTGMARADWRRIRVPLGLLLLLTLWIAIQLVPLPPGLWHSLPGRETIVAIDKLMGQPELWRSISLTPSATWNSLLAMTVPLAALLLVARVDSEDYPRLFELLILMAFTSALLGFIQILTGGSSVYFYRITNTDTMVGLFANRNHHAFFQAFATLLAAALLRDELMRKRQRGSIQLVLVLAIGLFTATTMLIGSRAGLLLGFATFVVGYTMIVLAWRGRSIVSHDEASRPAISRASRFWLYLPPLLVALLLATIIRLADRSTSFSRLEGRMVAEDMRIQAWPTVKGILESFWPTGSGFGSFPDIFKVFEPDSLLQASYFNHAHNDWAELVITGGLPFLLIVLTMLIWVGRKVAERGFRSLLKGYRGDNRLPLLVVILLLLAASLVDYPLRVPSLQAFAVMAVVLLCCPRVSRSGN
jgi:hypothetical protein